MFEKITAEHFTKLMKNYTHRGPVNPKHKKHGESHTSHILA